MRLVAACAGGGPAAGPWAGSPGGAPARVGERGAGDRIRTGDIQLGKLTLYQLSYSRVCVRRRASPNGVWWAGLDSNQRRHTPTDLQSVPFNHSGTYPRRQDLAAPPGHGRTWSHPSESNRQPSDYKSDALPVELGWHPDGVCPARHRTRRRGVRARIRRVSVASPAPGCQPRAGSSGGRPGRGRRVPGEPGRWTTGDAGVLCYAARGGRRRCESVRSACGRS
jgi:hypothetical protein